VQTLLLFGRFTAFRWGYLIVEQEVVEVMDR
jgi:hypothetical protein